VKKLLLASVIAVAFFSPANAGQKKVQLPIITLGYWCYDNTRQTVENVKDFTRGNCDGYEDPEGPPLVLGPDQMEGIDYKCKFTKIEEIVPGRTYDITSKCSDFGEKSSWNQKNRLWYVNGNLTLRREWIKNERETN
jgi:hypothetical protein